MESVAHRQAGSGRIFVVQGDLTAQRVEGIVNAANEQLEHRGGVAIDIVRVGGPIIQEESDQWVRDHGPLGPGQAAVTTGGSLQASHVIHVVGPRYHEGQDNSGLLTQAVVAALDAAGEIGLESVAMPAISAGIFGYPLREAASVIAGAVIGWLEEHPDSSVREVRLVVYVKATADDLAFALDEA